MGQPVNRAPSTHHRVPTQPPTTRRRRRRGTAFAAALLATAGALVAVTATTTTSAADAAPAADAGPLACTSARFFLSQSADGGGTQLSELTEDGTGTVQPTNIGVPTQYNYNALAYDTVGGYLYADFRAPDPNDPSDPTLYPVLGRIDRDGQYTGIARLTAGPGVDGQPNGVAAAFDDTKRYWIGGVDKGMLHRVNTKTGVADKVITLSGGAVLGGSDMTYANGYFWSVQDGGSGTERQIRRIDPNDGSTILVRINGFSTDEPQGADFTYGNGNIGTGGNSTGKITQIHIDDPASATPTATAINSIPGPASGGNDAAACAPDDVPLGITKTAPPQVAQGGTINWTIKVHNYSTTSTSSGFYVQDTVPANVTAPTLVNGPGTCSTPAVGLTFTCNEGAAALPPGGEITLTFSAKATTAAGATIVNSAQVFGNEQNSCATAGNPFGCSDRASATTVTPAPDLSISKSGPQAVAPGGTITYGLTVSNNGTGASAGSTVTDPVPAGVTNVSARLDANGQPCQVGGSDADGHTVTCTGPALPAKGATAPTYTITVTGTAPTTYETCVDNTATVKDVLAGAPIRSSNTIHTCTPGGSLDLHKAVSTDNAHPGDIVTYTVTATNNGTGNFSADHQASFQDALAGVTDDATYVPGSATASVGAAQVTGTGQDAVLSWAGVPVGTTPVTVTYQVRVDDPDTGDGHLINKVTSRFDPGCTTPCSTNTPVAKLVVAKTSSAHNPAPGSLIGYTLTVSNPGDGSWTSDEQATLTDDLSGVLDDGAVEGQPVITLANGQTTTAGLTFDTTAKTLTWTGPLAAHDSFTITYNVRLADPATGNHDLVNSVTAPHSGCQVPADCRTVDHEPDLLPVKTASAQAAQPGDTITYTITATNTGTGDWIAPNLARFDDDLSQVTDDATYNGDAVITLPSGAQTTAGIGLQNDDLFWQGELAAGQHVVLTYTVTVNNPDGGDHHLRNGVTSPVGVCGPNSPPGACPGTDLGIRDLTMRKDVSTTDVQPGDSVTYTITATNTGQADFTDDAKAPITDDLAGIVDDATVTAGPTVTDPDDTTDQAGIGPDNVLRWAGRLAVGHTMTITYTVTINIPDQGDHVLPNTVNSTLGNCVQGVDPQCKTPDVLVADLHSVKTADTANAAEGSHVTYTVTLTNTGRGDWTAAKPATFSDSLVNVLDDASFDGTVAISGAPEATATPATYVDPDITWSGALNAGDTVTFTYMVIVDTPDTGDHLMPNTVVTPGNCPPGSTDPACSTTIKNADLHTTKVASTTDTSEGKQVVYTITATNTGAGDWTAANPAVIDDNLTDVLSDADLDATPVATGAPEAVVNQPTYTAPSVSWTGALDAGDTVTITYTVTVHKPDTGDHEMINTVQAPGNCRTAQPECTAVVDVADLTVAKTADTTSPVPGSVVTYTLTATNTGKGDWTDTDPASITDDLTDVLDDATYDNDAATAGDSTVAPTYAQPTLSWSAPLAAGASITITYSVTVGAPDTGDHRLINAVTGQGNCRPGNTDPSCISLLLIPDLHLTKTASTADAMPGAVITYTLTATNTGPGDWTDLHPARVDDDLSGVLDDATYDNDAATTGDSAVPPTYAAPALSWAAPLAAGKTITITYSVTVDSPDGGDHLLPNTVIAPPGTNCAAGSTDPDCHKQTDVADLDIRKTASTQNVAPGQQLTFTITARSSGTGDWTADMPALLGDDLSGVLDDATYDDDAVTTGDSTIQPTYVAPELTWTGPLPAGASITISYTVTINDPDTGDLELPNRVDAIGNCVDPANPDCGVDPKVAHLSVRKVADRQDTRPGATVAYKITAVSDGKGDWTDTDPASFTDDLTDVLDDATYNGDAAAGGTSVAPTYDKPTLAWSGPLAAGATVTLTYTVTVRKPDTGDHELLNTVVTPVGNCEPDKTPFAARAAAPTMDPACSTDVPIGSYTITKTSDPKSGTAVRPGATVHYRVVIANTGKVVMRRTVTDDLTKVLDDARWNADAKATSGSVSFASPRLRWTGVLALHARVVVTYSVTVSRPDRGDGDLVNVVTGDGPLTNCGSGDTSCRTDNRVDPPDPTTGIDQDSTGRSAGQSAAGGTLASTAAMDARAWVLLAGALTLTGLLALGVAALTGRGARRRRPGAAWSRR